MFEPNLNPDLWVQTHVDALMDKCETLMEECKMHEGMLLLTPICVCESAAGLYIGTWCVENVDGNVMAQPYERVSDYIPKNQRITAEMVAKAIREIEEDNNGTNLAS